jgi:uncharacterized protein
VNILIDIGHPAHVHYFRNLYNFLQKDHNIVVTCKTVPMIKHLLSAYDIPFIELGKKGGSLIGKIRKQVGFNQQIRNLIIDKKIDIAMGVSLSVIYAAKFSKASSIFFIDDDQAVEKLTAKYAAPYADTIISPDVLSFENMPKGVYYPGYHELAYLHPKVYQPNPNVLSKYGLNEQDDFFVLRFTALKAYHDTKAAGMSHKQKHALIDLLNKYGKVYITMESGIDKEFEQYRMPIAPHEMHDFLAFSRMLVSDSQTMSSEAAVLGVPSFRCNTFAGKISYLEEEEKRYGLTFGFQPHQFDWMLERIGEHLAAGDHREEWRQKRDKMLADKISVTDFWIWFITNYPASRQITTSGNLDYDRFR